jgi:hypothetical protein
MDASNDSENLVTFSKEKLQQHVDMLCVWTDDQPWRTVLQAYRAGVRDLLACILSDQPQGSP